MNSIKNNFRNENIKEFIFYDNFDLKKNIYFGRKLDSFNTLDFVSSDIEIHQKDVKFFYDLDFQYMNNRVTYHKYLIQQLLNLLLMEKVISPEDYRNYLKKNDDKFRNEVDNFNEKCSEIIKDIRSKYEGSSQDKTLQESQIELEIIEQLPHKADCMINQIVQSQISYAQHLIEQLQNNNKLTEEDANQLLNMFLHNAQSLEVQLDKYKKESQLINEEKLRNLNLQLKKEVIDKNITEKQYQQREISLSTDILKKLDTLPQVEHDQIINEYKGNVTSIRKRHEEEYKRQKLLLEAKLQNMRKEEMERAIIYRNSQLNKLQETLRKSSLNGDGKLPLEMLHLTEQSIDNDMKDIMKKIEDVKVKECDKLKEQTDQSINTEIDKLEREIIQQTFDKFKPQSTKSILESHLRNVYDIKMKLSLEKQRQIKKMNEILNAKNSKSSEELVNGIEAQLDEKIKQEKVFTKTIDDQLILPQNLKNKIIEEGKSDSIAVQNQIEATKIRQQKLMELALAKRMKEKINCEKEKNPNDKKQTDPTISNPEKTEMEIYEEFVKQFDQEKTKFLLETRDKLVNETKEALKLQEDYMASIMAKYTISHARKLKAKKNLDNLYENLFNEMSKKTTKSLSAKQVMDQFTNEKENIEKQRQTALKYQKEQLEKALEDRKIQAQNQTKAELEKHYINQLAELEKSGISQDAVDFVDLKFSDEIAQSVENVEKEIKQQFAKEIAKYSQNLDETKFEKNLNKNIISTISNLVDISKTSRSELIDIINQKCPNIDDNIKENVIKEIYRRKSIAFNEKPQLSFEKPKENDYFIPPDTRNNQVNADFRSAGQDYNFDETDNIPMKKRKSKQKKKKNVELIDDVESDF